MNVAIPHNIPYFSEAQKTICAEVLSGTDLVGGIQTKRFEDALCEYLGLPEGHVVLVSSGSAALYLSLWALGLQNKSIALPVYSCSALSRAVKLLGSTPVFVDSLSESFNMDTSRLDDSISGLIFPHMYGVPSKINVSSSIRVVEDCAQSLGARINGKPVGLQGDIGIYSFYATKIITSGGHGGACFSKDKNLIDSIRDYVNFDCKSADIPGFNFLMTELQAAFGFSQFMDLDRIVKKRAKLFDIYKSYLLPLYNEHYDSDFLCPIRYRAIVKTDRQNDLISTLLKSNIKAIVPIEDWELLSQHFDVFPNAYKLAKNTVSLPLYSALTDEQASFIGHVAQRALKKHLTLLNKRVS